MSCKIIYALNYVSLSFDISIKEMVSEIKRIPLMEMSGSTSEIHVHLYIVVQCGLLSICEDGTTISVVDCVKFSILVNKCVRPSCSLGGSTYPQKSKKQNKARDSLYNVSFLFSETFVVSRYLLDTLGDSHYFL
jgi:hypothetical protein